MRRQQLLIYRDFDSQEIYCWMAELMEGEPVHLYDTINRLIEMAAQYGFEGNIWHCYLAYVLANHENAFSTACEVVGRVDGSINRLALHDFRVFMQMFRYDLADLDARYGTIEFGILKDYKGVAGGSRVYNQRVHDRIEELADTLAQVTDENEFLLRVTEFYRDFGVGKFGLHKAFKVDNVDGEVQILPITRTEHVSLDDLVGYEIQKKKLVENTEAFIQGRKANNCLLFGDAGTGKSSSIKAIMNTYYEQGLRLIEIYKYQFKDLTGVISQIKNRNYKFIIYMDDLSFEDFEVEYKYLKAIIEGGMERKPDNVLIYATSNRRHLIRENFSDKRAIDDELHTSDTVQEKLSLAARFGVTIYFGMPAKKEFQTIVRTLAARNGIRMTDQELLAEANAWELQHGGMSGRTAQQFITHLLSIQKDQVQ